MTENAIARDYRPVLSGIYVRADQPIDFAQSSRAVAVAHTSGVLGGWSAAALHGHAYVPEDAVVELILGERAGRRKGVRFRYDLLEPDEHEDVYGYELTTHIRTAFDLGRSLPFTDAVEAVDGLCNIGNFEPELLNGLVARRPGVRGIKQLRTVIPMADRGAGSPWETKTRMLVVGAGIPRPQTQVILLDERGKFFAQVDMAWPEYRVALEYEGDHHRMREEYLRGIRRTNKIHRVGWDIVFATHELVTRYPGELIAAVVDALRAGGSLRGSCFRRG